MYQDGSFLFVCDIIILMDEPKIIYKDKDFLAIDKSAGILVHGVAKKSDSETTLVDWLLKNYPEIKGVGDEPEMRPGIVHRLDKDTSGVMLAARNQKAFDYLKKLFGNREIKKTYLALVFGKVNPPAGGKIGIINKSIKIKSGTIKRTVWKGKDEKTAVTEYEVIKLLKLKVNKGNQGFSLLRIFPKTGRTHQIRVHLASIGHSIVGDSLYGFKKNNFGLKRQFLHAESIEFTDISGKRVKIESDLPEELSNFLKILQKD